jgi:TolB protein
MTEPSSPKTILVRYRLLFLVGLLLSVCICAMIGILFYRADPPSDAVVYAYEINEAFGVYTITPDGDHTLPLFYSNPTRSRVVNVWENAPQVLKQPLLPMIEQDIPYRPAWVAGGRQVTFRVRVHGRDCAATILMEANGSNSRPVACLGRDYREEAIAWSPDGKHLAVAHWEVDQTVLKQLDPQGNLVHEWSIPAKVWGISWSPDSTRMAITVDGSASLQIIHQDFTARYFSPEANAFGQPTWSPNGELVAFFCNSNERIDICTMNANGSDYHRIYFPNNFPFLKYNLRWSPGEDNLLFEALQPSGYNDLFLINADGSDLRQLTFHPAADTQPAWSPDGSQIIFVSLRDGNWEIYRIQADGTDLFRVTFTPGDEREPSWRPASP